jgi:alpha-mannosidase
MAQCLGPVQTRLAIMPHAGHWSEADIAAAAEAFRCPLVAVNGSAPLDTALARQAGLAVSGDGVVMTSLRRRDPHWLELRLLAAGDAPSTATVGAVRAARRADLLGGAGAELSVVDGQVTLPLRPWEIATIQLAHGA